MASRTMKGVLVRKIAAGALLVLGIVLQLFAPETWVGLIVMGLAISIELIGIALKRGGRSRSP